jgi:ubiquinol-cytochrome c reductase cytochrome b subunit
MRIVKNLWDWIDDRAGLSNLLGPFLSHPVPPGVGWAYVFGSGTLFAFILQVVTGIALATAYVPSTANAYQSLQFITHEALFGRILRGLHFFGASAMILLIGIHAIRVFLTGSFKFPREVNWLSGSILLLLVVAMGFTGQLLRWDQNAIWSVIVGAEQAGRFPVLGSYIAHFLLAGDTVGGATLSRFFAFHVFFIPAIIFAILGFHLFLVLKNGISEPPVSGKPVDPMTYRQEYEKLLEEKGRPFWPDFAWRDALFAFLMVVGVFILAWVYGPPELGKLPDPSIVQAYPRPDWYLLWLFAILALLPPGLENYFIVLGPLVVGVVLILLPFIAGKGERNPMRRPWAMAAVAGIVIMVGSLWVAGVNADWSPDFSAQPLPAQVIGASSGPVYQGSQLFYSKGCEYCHNIAGYGGHRGPDLTTVGDRLTQDEMIIRIATGGTNMPPFGATLTPQEMNDLVSFLQSRKAP